MRVLVPSFWLWFKKNFLGVRFWLVLALLFSMFFDMVSTLVNGFGREINPLFIIFGSVFLLFFVKVVITGLIIYWLYKPFFGGRRLNYFVLVLVVVLLVFAQLYAGINNFYVYKSTPVEERGYVIDYSNPGEVLSSTLLYFRVFFWLVFLPLLSGSLAFYFYNRIRDEDERGRVEVVE